MYVCACTCIWICHTTSGIIFFFFPDPSTVLYISHLVWEQTLSTISPIANAHIDGITIVHAYTCLWVCASVCGTTGVCEGDGVLIQPLVLQGEGLDEPEPFSVSLPCWMKCTWMSAVSQGPVRRVINILEGSVPVAPGGGAKSLSSESTAVVSDAKVKYVV